MATLLKGSTTSGHDKDTSSPVIQMDYSNSESDPVSQSDMWDSVNDNTVLSEVSADIPRRNLIGRYLKFANPRTAIIKTAEWADTSFMVAPLCGMVMAAVLAGMALYVDAWMSAHDNIHMPSIVATTTTASQNILIAVASATISFASSAFAISMLVFQLSSQQYSPRIVSTLFRDPYNKKIIGLVIGSLTYSLVCLQRVSQPNLDPHITTWVAIVLGVVTVIAVVFFIDHTAKTLDISRLLRHVASQAIYAVKEKWPLAEPHDVYGDQKMNNIKSKYNDLRVRHIVRFRQRGWIVRVDLESLERLVPRGGFLKVHTTEGRYALPGVAAVSVSSKVGISELDDQQRALEIFRGYDNMHDFDRLVLEAIAIGVTRSVRYDPSFGLRQLVDVACKALSPAINDPTTAQDAIYNAASVVIEYLQRRPPVAIICPDKKGGGQLILEEQMSYDAVVRYAYNEVRSCAKKHASVCIYLLESLALIRSSTRAAGHSHIAPEIERQAQLIVKGIESTGEIEADKERVREYMRLKFPELCDNGEGNDSDKEQSTTIK